MFKVEKVADVATPLFVPDPSDPNNTVDSGYWVQEVTLSRVPDPMRGGLGTITLWLNEVEQIRKFGPGQVVTVELRGYEL